MDSGGAAARSWPGASRPLEGTARSGGNLIPPMLDCARAYCTLYEIREALERVYGAYREPVFFQA